jgi:6-pyruvoyltetrahydropterin/6-carboxytetrahydropterin synthase
MDATTTTAMCTIVRKFGFSAAHRLWHEDLSAAANDELYGPCTRLHGHNYTLYVHITGTVDARTGMVLNLKKLAWTVHEQVISQLDHQCLNDIISRETTTVETVAQWIHGQLLKHGSAWMTANVSSVQVHLWETDNNGAIYPPCCALSGTLKAGSPI